MSGRERARTIALTLCAAAVLTGTLAVLIYTGTLDVGLDPDVRQMLSGVLALGVLMDLVMARVLYVRLSAKK